MIQRILFWLSAKNRHGVHSPFIYNFLDRGLYDPKYRGLPGTEKLLLAATDYFRPRRLGHSPGATELARLLTSRDPDLSIAKPPFDLCLFNAPDTGLSEWISNPANWHNNSIVFVGGLDKPGKRSGWLAACRLPEARIQLETYCAGLLFFRKEQAPEHFKIRL